MSSHRLIVSSSVLTLMGATVASCASREPEEPAGPSSSALSAAVAEVLEGNGESLIYESIRHVGDNQDATLVSQVGELDNELFQRYARPLAYAHEDSRVHFAAWRVQLEDGTVEEGTRVTSTSPGAATDTTPEPETYVDPRLAEEASAEADDGLLPVLIRVRGFPDWYVPLVPDAASVGVSSLAAALEDEAEALAARQELLDDLGSDLIALVGELGGSLDQKLWSVGWLAVTVPASALEVLAAHPSVQSLTSARPATGMAQSKETVRPLALTGEQAYWNGGQLGDQPNPARHAAGAITVAVIEAGPAKDEARGFCQDASCSSTKFFRRYRCDQSGSFPCVITSNYPAALENFNYDATDHATTVATAAVADYLDDQLAGQTLTFKLAATSGPREAKLIHLGGLGGFSGYPGEEAQVTFAEAFYVAANFNKADIVTGATFITYGALNPDLNPPAHDCDFPSIVGHILATTPSEMAAENAFDAGSFVAIAPGNWCGPTATGFVSASPAHLPKVFTVTGLSVTASGCGGDYRNCKVSLSNSIRGGAPAKIGSFTFPNALTVVDLAVPQGLTHFTRCSQFGNGSPCLPAGFVVTSGGDSGTSFATPRLAGYAALVKDWFIQHGLAWFNSPGWLHVTMLGQGDAHFSTAPATSTPTTRKTIGADPIYGLGRAKLRHPDQFASFWHDFRSLSFTSTTPVTYFVGNAPLHSSTQILKCVMVGHEDMSHKNDIGRVRLEVRLRTPVGGQCSSLGALVGSLIDNTADVKHMVAFRGSNGQVGGRCAEVTIRPTALPTTGSVWTQTFCYAASEEDDAPH